MVSTSIEGIQAPYPQRSYLRDGMRVEAAWLVDVQPHLISNSALQWFGGLGVLHMTSEMKPVIGHAPCQSCPPGAGVSVVFARHKMDNAVRATALMCFRSHQEHDGCCSHVPERACKRNWLPHVHTMSGSMCILLAQLKKGSDHRQSAVGSVWAPPHVKSRSKFVGVFHIDHADAARVEPTAPEPLRVLAHEARADQGHSAIPVCGHQPQVNALLLILQRCMDLPGCPLDVPILFMSPL